MPSSACRLHHLPDRKSTRLNSSHLVISYAVFCLKKKIEDVLAARPVLKKMEGEPITFYPPTYRPNPYFRRDKPGMWGFSLRGIRDFAPSFLAAEAEAMRIYRGFRRLNP